MRLNTIARSIKTPNLEELAATQLDLLHKRIVDIREEAYYKALRDPKVANVFWDLYENLLSQNCDNAFSNNILFYTGELYSTSGNRLAAALRDQSFREFIAEKVDDPEEANAIRLLKDKDKAMAALRKHANLSEIYKHGENQILNGPRRLFLDTEMEWFTILTNNLEDFVLTNFPEHPALIAGCEKLRGLGGNNRPKNNNAAQRPRQGLEL